MTRHFTGRHMAMLFIGFFGVVIAVNLFMAHSAIGTFGGTVVDNSYVASQKFNGWMAQGRAQQAAGWRASMARGPDGHALVTLSRAGQPVDGAVLNVSARRMGSQEPARVLTFTPAGGGRYRSMQPLPEGRWQLEVAAQHSGAVTRHRIELP